MIASLRRQGYLVQGGKMTISGELTKERVRALHAQAVRKQLAEAKPRLGRYEDRLLERCASGSEVVPELIAPRLVEVRRGSEDELLFRYARLHWSVPVSAGYGRRARFLVVDEHNQKLIGVIGLGDPVFSLRARDDWVGWSIEDRALRLTHVMDAFVLGALPPYSDLLGGKLISMLALSNEVREAVRKKYARRSALISGRRMSGQLAMITTSSALGRSSIYNRLRFRERALVQSVGYTRGSGDFHFANGLYDAMAEFTRERCVPTARRSEWGQGFRNRRELIKKCLPELGISSEWIYHGVRREVFVAPLATNTREFLRGEARRVESLDQPAAELFDHFRQRWLLPRADRRQNFREFNKEDLRLWV